MRMNDDHLHNDQLKPGYNVQISTINQVILNFNVYPNPADTLMLPSHLNSYHYLY